MLLAFLPAAAVGFLLHHWIEEHLFSVRAVAAALIVGGVVIWLVERRPRPATVQRMEAMGWREALWVGVAQVTSLYPGVSRAAATIIGGMLAGMSRPAATQFSFYLALPTLTAASLFSLAKALPHDHRRRSLVARRRLRRRLRHRAARHPRLPPLRAVARLPPLRLLPHRARPAAAVTDLTGRAPSPWDRGRPARCSRTAPRPILSAIYETSLHRILRDVFDRRVKMLLVSNHTVPIVRPPHAPTKSGDACDLLGRERFPTVYDLGDRMTTDDLHEDVDMVRHHHPRHKPVPHAFEVEPVFDHEPRHFWAAQETAPGPRIEKCFEPLAAIALVSPTSDRFTHCVSGQ